MLCICWMIKGNVDGLFSTWMIGFCFVGGDACVLGCFCSFDSVGLLATLGAEGESDFMSCSFSGLAIFSASLSSFDNFASGVVNLLDALDVFDIKNSTEFAAALAHVSS